MIHKIIREKVISEIKKLYPEAFFISVNVESMQMSVYERNTSFDCACGIVSQDRLIELAQFLGMKDSLSKIHINLGMKDTNERITFIDNALNEIVL